METQVWTLGYVDGPNDCGNYTAAINITTNTGTTSSTHGAAIECHGDSREDVIAKRARVMLAAPQAAGSERYRLIDNCDAKDGGYEITDTAAVPWRTFVVGLREEQACMLIEELNARPPADALIYPATLTPELEHALGFMNFRTGPIAHIYQAAGYDIKSRAEPEQAFVLDRFIRAVIQHGEGWLDAIAKDMDITAAKAKELKEAKK